MDILWLAAAATFFGIGLALIRFFGSLQKED